MHLGARSNSLDIDEWTHTINKTSAKKFNKKSKRPKRNSIAVTGSSPRFHSNYKPSLHMSVLSNGERNSVRSGLTVGGGIKNASEKKRMWDGTSEKELLKAMSTFLNCTSPGDY
jgi:hypothetical protein